jgi:hypothetical protein
MENDNNACDAHQYRLLDLMKVSSRFLVIFLLVTLSILVALIAREALHQETARTLRQMQIEMRAEELR